jgi:hypothetical protein
VTPTLRRLNDREQYWGLTWPAWIGCAVAGTVLYLSIRISPFGTKATVTAVLLLSAFAAMALAGVSGQALSPLRQLRAVAIYRCSAKRYRLKDNASARGVVVLDREPQLILPAQEGGGSAWR